MYIGRIYMLLCSHLFSIWSGIHYKFPFNRRWDGFSVAREVEIQGDEPWEVRFVGRL